MDIVAGILLQDWARTGLNRADFVRPSNYELYLEAPFNRVEYYPIGVRPNSDLYPLIENWLGRLILPQGDERISPRFVWMEIYHAPPAHQSLVGRTVMVQWDSDPEVQAYGQLVTMDVHFAERVQVSKRQGVVHLDRINY